MRRPLCLICLAFVITVIIILFMCPLPSEDYSELAGRTYTLEGKVYKKECKEDICYVYLKYVIFSDTSKNSNNNSKYEKIHSLSNQENQTNIINKNYNVRGVICLVPAKSDPKLGSIIQIRGKIAIYPIATNEGEFNQRQYWKIQNIDFQVKDGEILRSSNSFNQWSEYLYCFKKKCELKYEATMDKTHASIIKAMLLGNKKTLNQDIKSLYQRSGIAHILAISGLHISVIGIGIYKLLRKLYISVGAAASVSIFIMYNYGLMTDMSSSSYRAITMFSIYLLSKIMRRSYDMLTAMTLSAVCMIIEQPQYVFNTAFQLSFGAIIGMGLVYPAFRHLCHTENKFFNSVLISLSISITTMPVILYSYYEIPTYSILLNLLIIPLMTLLLLFGLTIIPACSISMHLAKIVALPCSGILMFYEWICNLTEQLPGHSWIVGKPSAVQIIIFYIGLLVLVFCYEKISVHGAFLLCAIIISVLTIRVNDDLRITMIDVGQGDGFCIQSPFGNVYLIDSGSSSKSKVGTYQVIPFLKSKGIYKLQYIFVTHSDNDHINAIKELIELSGNGNGIKIKNLVLPKIGTEYQDEAYRRLIESAELKGILVNYMMAGDSLVDQKMKFTCLHPEKNFVPKSANAYSNVLWLSYGKFDALFTGDVEGNGEEALIESIQYSQTEKNERICLEILKIAHHGSKNSTSEKLLTLCKPRIGLLSCGLNNSYGHPHQELLERLEDNKIPYVMTSKSGAVEIRTDGERILLHTFLDNQEYSGKCR